MSQSPVVQASIKRVEELMDQKQITLYELAYQSAVSYSTLKVALNRRQTISLQTIKKLCDGGLNMSISEFFASPLFDEPEIQ